MNVLEKGKSYFTPSEKRALLSNLISMAKKDAESFELLKFIAFSRSFRKYSFYNSALIYLQCPHASLVAGEKQWKRKYGRMVKNGESGIYILVPYFRGDYFAVIPVYDISQTEGKELPEYLEQAFAVRGEFEETWFDRLLQYAEDLGASVNYEKLGIGTGGSIATDKASFTLDEGSAKTAVTEDARLRILLNGDLPRSSQFSVLVHELSHLHLGHLGGSKKRRIPDRHCVVGDLQEIEAESVVHLVCTWLDLETFSSRYLGLHRKGLDKEICETAVIYAAGKIERAIHDLSPASLKPTEFTESSRFCSGRDSRWSKRLVAAQNGPGRGTGNLYSPLFENKCFCRSGTLSTGKTDISQRSLRTL
jgi:hypothetical protein